MRETRTRFRPHPWVQSRHLGVVAATGLDRREPWDVCPEGLSGEGNGDKMTRENLRNLLGTTFDRDEG